MPVVSISKQFRYPMGIVTVAEAETIASPLPATALDAGLDAAMAWLARRETSERFHAAIGKLRTFMFRSSIVFMKTT
jgi:hypothetical protein